MRVGILGSGLMGGKLGTIFARAGHKVVFSYARSPQKLQRLARDAGGNASAGKPADAARDADALLVAVHWSKIDDVLKRTGDLSGKVIVTCSLPMNADDTGLVVGHSSSGAEELGKKVPQAQVVSAFGRCRVKSSSASSKRGTSCIGGIEPSLAYCGDDVAAKNLVATLIGDAGFDPVDAGPLRVARYMEPFSLLMGQLAYEGDAGPEIAYRFVGYDK